MSLQNLDTLYEYLGQKGFHYEKNADLSKKTWIHRGGVANCWISVKHADELEELCTFLYKHDLGFIVVGHTSNLYFKNTCNPLIIVSTLQCNHFELESDYIYCESGVSVSKLAKAAVNSGIAGFEYLTDLPGTIGGALCNNSSCGNNSISKLLEYAEYIDDAGSVSKLTYDDFNYSFRTSDFKTHRKKGVITKIWLKKSFDEREKLIAISKENEEQRKRNLGSGAMNLGCTVNRCFINGQMPLNYRIRQSLYTRVLSLFVKDNLVRRRKLKEHILKITNYSELIPYVSDYSMIIYLWKDASADTLFPRYLEFMNKIYRTDKIEIEVLE